MTDQRDEHPETSYHVIPESIEIGEFGVEGGYVIAGLQVVVCGRTEDLTLVVLPFGQEISVEVQEAVLDYAALTAVAEDVAAKLNTVAGRAALKRAAESPRRARRRRPHVHVRLVESPDQS